MKALFLIVLLKAIKPATSTCTECVTAFSAAEDGDKCTAAVTAATCLLAGTDATCTGESPNSAEKQLKDGTDTVYKVAKTKSCGITDLCSCQAEYATKAASRIDSTSTATKCNEAKAYKTCVVGKDAAMKACDGKKLQPAIKTEAEGKLTEFCNEGISVVVGVKQFLMMIALAVFQNYLKY